MRARHPAAVVLVAVGFAGLVLHQLSRTSSSARAPAPQPAASTAAQPPDRDATPSGPGIPVGQTPPAAPPPTREATSPPFTSDQKVALLRQLVDELPAQRIPELRLLTPAEWQNIAHAHELSSTADIRNALADLRALARKKFAEVAQDALRRFAADSGDAFPTDVQQLARYLTAPADAAMLDRYTLATEAGKPGEPPRKILREKPTSDLILSVSPDGWNISNNSTAPVAFGETELDSLERAWRTIPAVLGDEAHEKMATMASPRVMSELLEGTVKALEPVYGDSDAVGDAMKQAVKLYLTAHPDEKITDVAQILPFLRDADKFTATLRPMFAQLEYLREHNGQPPADPALLQPYLQRHFDVTTAFRELKLAWDGEHLTMTYSWGK